ncbi:flippase [Candidatus Micrarchaeota archaeon]|nr:flippase [Candidatus Micrarchaeota archaeon]
MEIENRKTIAKGAVWTFLSQIAIKFLSFIYLIVIARLFSQEDIGTFYLALSILGILYVVADLGLLQSLIRHVPYYYGKKQFDKLNMLVKFSYIFGGGMTLLFSVILFFFSGTIADVISQPDVTPVLQILAIWLFIKEVYDIGLGILLGRKRMKESQLLESSEPFLKLILTLIAFYIMGSKLDSLTIPYIVSFTLVAGISTYLAVKENRGWNKSIEQFNIQKYFLFGKNIISFGIVMTALGLFGTLLSYIDRVMLGVFMGQDAGAGIAIYTFAVGLASIITIFPTTIKVIFYPVVSELYGANKIDEMKKVLDSSLKWVIILTIPMFLVIAIFSGKLLGMIYGIEYEEGAFVLLMFSIGFTMSSLIGIQAKTLAAINRLDVNLKRVITASVVNIVLNLILIPNYGINGAAVASAVSLTLSAMLIMKDTNEILEYKVTAKIYKPIIAGVMSMAFLVLTKPYVFIGMEQIPGISIGISGEEIYATVFQKLFRLFIFGVLFVLASIIYFITLLLLKVFSSDDILILGAGLKKIKVPEEIICRINGILEAKWLRFP